MNIVSAQETDSMPSTGIFDLLQSESAKEITITSNLNELLNNSKSTNEYTEGDFTFERPDEVEMTIPVKIRGRGRYRRMKCEFPPLKLKFRKDDLAAHNLNEFNELKLVTHCLDERETSRELILREYLTYRLFNILCPYSLRAQLVKVNYINTEKKPKKIKGWGILIEDADELAYRLKGTRYEQMGLPDSSFDSKQENMLSLFQYMIGNTDWSLRMVRNVEIIRMANDLVIAVPYDFDFAGVVSAPYARPNTDIGQTSLRQRIFQGNATNLEELQATLEQYFDKKDALLKAVREMKFLAPESKFEIEEYLEEFFYIIENKEQAEQHLFPNSNKGK